MTGMVLTFPYCVVEQKYDEMKRGNSETDAQRYAKRKSFTFNEYFNNFFFFNRMHEIRRFPINVHFHCSVFQKKERFLD